MSPPRTVTAFEHEVIPVVSEDAAADSIAPEQSQHYVTVPEALALFHLNDTRRGFCQQDAGGVKLAQYCGVVRLQTCVLEVLPKLGMREGRETGELERSRAALIGMLRSAQRLRLTTVEAAPQNLVRAPLLDVFIEAFLQAALEQARRGLLSRYMQDADDLRVVKGRLNAQHNVRRNVVRPHLVHCDFDEFTPDNQYNRAVRAALSACRTWMSRASTQRLWFETQTRFASVTQAPLTSADVARLPRDRTTERYEAVLDWSEHLLALQSPSLSAGCNVAPGLLFDMNKLFESHVSTLEEKAAGNTTIVHRQGPQKHLAMASDAFLLRPDITVWRASNGPDVDAPERIIDAKWKRVDWRDPLRSIDPADIYQALAYGIRYGCRNLELALPSESLQVLPADTIVNITEKADTASIYTIKVRPVPI